MLLAYAPARNINYLLEKVFCCDDYVWMLEELY